MKPELYLQYNGQDLGWYAADDSLDIILEMAGLGDDGLTSEDITVQEVRGFAHCTEDSYTLLEFLTLGEELVSAGHYGPLFYILEFGLNADDAHTYDQFFCGEYDSLEDYAEQQLTEIYKCDDALLPYLDFAGYAHDLFNGGDFSYYEYEKTYYIFSNP